VHFNKYPYIIAEAGVNHNGLLINAFKLIDAAVKAGADCVKFQAFSSDELVTKIALKAEYQKREEDESQHDMLSKFELLENDFKLLYKRCEKRGIDFLITPFSPRWVKILYNMGVSSFKISSGSVNSLALLQEVARTRLPVILSTGMSSIEEIRRAINVLKEGGCNSLSLLHCVSLYPAPIEKINLFSIGILEGVFNVPVGFSDHTIHTLTGGLAIAAGATILEKHFTLDKNMKGPDHKSSLSPGELKSYIEVAKLAVIACGKKIKKISNEEVDIKKVAQSSLVVKRFIKKGQIIQRDMLTEKRPATGISPMNLWYVRGKQAIRDLQVDETLTYDCLKE